MCNQAHEVQDLFAHLEQVFGIVLRHHRLEHLRQRHGASSASIAGQSGEHRRSIRSITGQSGASRARRQARLRAVATDPRACLTPHALRA